ncbi:phosphoribosylglycinamide formyltransferase [uncultured Clostridium sp.]|uniref:phosphoribosylglycinamide formyltransferase n=1 Tax=uncultured Clostridium sp. TaxID=59620 RepID=UPI002610BF37|nr:phosphoribosylglycinamide formyltransferase [uncultured Clostridium sp.]
MLKIAILISGGGSNMESILNSIDSKFLSNVEVITVISDRDAKGIEIAKQKGFNTRILDRKVYKSNLSDKILEILDGNVDYIVLAGFLSIISNNLIRKFKNRIINIHPSLIPSFCGAGMYGMKVHKAAIDKGVKFSGCTVHFVNEEVDGGAIIKQEIVEVLETDTPEILQKRILKKEHIALPSVLKLISENKLEIINNKVKISL